MIELDHFTFDRRSLSEADLKAVVINALRSELEGSPHAAIANEFRLGSTPVRVDLAALGKNFIGIEIKSSKDTLKRLPHQMVAYASYFDRVILAVADIHLPNLDWKSLRSVEVWSISESGKVRVVSQPTQIAECAPLSDLLTAEQRSRHKISEDSSEQEIATAFDAEFRKRFAETSLAFWAKVKGRRIIKDDLEILSRFRDRRLEVERWSGAQDAEWHDWSAQVSQALS